MEPEGSLPHSHVKKKLSLCFNIS